MGRGAGATAWANCRKGRFVANSSTTISRH
ncbi:unnamed protein product [Strongylus vulgaris]|uniref:Uncharacterized protein n=1 Tax=Strongylus vulgaris TaxID=40348 RepID=A0A3P7IP66_STRVU|nr:unnamed protein product [Strongylus vulgaris]